MSYKLEQTIKEEYFQRIIKLIHSDQGINRIGKYVVFPSKSSGKREPITGYIFVALPYVFP